MKFGLSNLTVHLIVWVGLLILTLVLHQSALYGWWRFDDSLHLVFVNNHCEIWQYFALPQVYRGFGDPNLSPWSPLLARINLQVFGFNPTGFYARHLLALWLAAVMSFYLLRLWLPVRWSLAASVLFLLGVPVALAAQQVMTGHYLDGLLFFVVALYAFGRSVREDRPGLACWGGFFYLLAILAKDIFVPAPLILPFLPVGQWRQRIKRAIPFGAILLGYLPYRWYMVGMPGGDHHGILDVWDILLNVKAMLFGNDVWGNIALGIIVLLFCALVLRSPSALGPVAVALTVLMAPLLFIPVLENINEQSRLLVFMWWAVAMFISVALARLARAKTALVYVAMAVWVGLGSTVYGRTRREVRAVLPQYVQFETQARFIMASNQRRIIVTSPPMQGYLNYFPALRKVTIGWNNIPVVMEDFTDLQILRQLGLLEENTVSSVWIYNPVTGAMANPGVPFSAENISSNAPLTIAAHVEANRIHWQFGPHTHGKYSVIKIQDGMISGKIQHPAKGQGDATGVDPFRFFVRYDSPEGWITYSPVFDFNLQGPPIVWRR